MPPLFIERNNIPAWLEALAAESLVFATQRESGAVIFKRYDPDQEIVFDRESVTSPKASVFTQTKALFAYATTSSDDSSNNRVELQEFIDTESCVVFGARPCGVRGFETFDCVFGDGEKKDPYYLGRRENTFFITIACDSPGATCFCHWTGGGPGESRGSDVMLTPVDGGFTADVLTKKGEELVGLGEFKAAGAKEEEARQVRAKAVQILGTAPDISNAASALDSCFSDLGFWEDMTAACNACDVCTYLCPTCYCFNITDESDGVTGVRMRTWDSCMSHLYSLEASGHNPRPSKAHRMRNRVNHKFWYFPERNQGRLSCVGCGRCVKHCPGSVDIRHILLQALERSK